MIFKFPSLYTGSSDQVHTIYRFTQACFYKFKNRVVCPCNFAKDCIQFYRRRGVKQVTISMCWCLVLV